jgi:Coenzyme PQQ synthesis protein D (PqqD)
MFYARNVNVEEAPLQHETILLQPAAKTFCVLNRTAAFIWKEMSATYSSELIARRLKTAFEGVSADRAVKDVKSTLQSLAALGFVNALEADIPVSSTSE